MAPRDDLPTPEEFAADRIPYVPEVAPKPHTFHTPTIKAFSMSGKTSKNPAFGSASMGGTPSDPTDDSNTPSDPNHTPSPYVEVGASGLAQYGGFVRDEFLPQLQGDRGLRVYREMYDNDPIVGALVFAVQMLMRKVEWRVEAPESNTVEGIVQARQKALKDQLLARQQAKQQENMMAQAGVAGKSQGASFTDQSPTGATIAGPGTPPPKPAMASGVSEGTTPFHQPVPGVGNGVKPPTPAAPKPPAPVAKDMADAFEQWWEQVSKATSAGGMVGGIEATGVGPIPIDPETGEPMEFPLDDDPTNVSPEELHAMELAVFVETALHDMMDSWSDTISQIITMIVYGFALHELVYKKRNGPNMDDPTQGSRFADGKIGWAKIAGRAQETRFRWEFDEYGNVLGMWQLAPPKFQLKYIPLSKALLFRTTGYKQNPEGRSILRSAYRPWYFKRRIEEIEAIGIERDLAGLPIAYVPWTMMSPMADPSEIAALNEVKHIVRNVRRDEQEGLVFPSAYDPDSHQPLFKFELLASPSRRSFDTDKVIARYDQRIAMVALVDFILLGHESVGSRALADTKADLFTTALESWLNVIADVFNTSAIPRLMQINGEDPAMSPRLTFGKLSRISLTEIGALITAMAGAGADLFPDQALEDFLRESGGMPPKAASNDL